MDNLRLKLKEEVHVPMEAELICPDVIHELSMDEVKQLPLQYGNKSYPLMDFFHVDGTSGKEIEVTGDLSKCKKLGEKMSFGSLLIKGDTGMHLGNQMTGGSISVQGNADDWAGAEMRGGEIRIQGNAGHFTGGAYRGSTKGMNNGTIVIQGNAGDMTGELMMRGLIVVMGDAGDYTGCMMKGGTIAVFGQCNQRTGGGLIRGTLICMQEPDLLPAFRFNCRYSPPFIPLVWNKLRSLGINVDRHYDHARYLHYSGDISELGKGEIIVYDQNQ